MSEIKGRTPAYELRKFEILSPLGEVIRTQLGLAGILIGETARYVEDEKTTTFLVESLPEADKNGVLGVIGGNTKYE